LIILHRWGKEIKQWLGQDHGTASGQRSPEPIPLRMVASSPGPGRLHRKPQHTRQTRLPRHYQATTLILKGLGLGSTTATRHRDALADAAGAAQIGEALSRLLALPINVRLRFRCRSHSALFCRAQLQGDRWIWIIPMTRIRLLRSITVVTVSRRVTRIVGKHLRPFCAAPIRWPRAPCRARQGFRAQTRH
jgi:hypothetical protein